MSRPRSSALRALVSPLQEDVFLRDYFPQRLHVSHGPLGRFARLLDVDQLKDAESVARACRTRVRVWSHGVDVRVDGVDAMECYRAGMTLYMNEVERFIPAVDRLVRRVATDLGIPFDPAAESSSRRSRAPARPCISTPTTASTSRSGGASAGGPRPTAGSPIPWSRTAWASRTSAGSSRRTPPDRCPIGCRPTAGLTTCGRARSCISREEPGTRPRWSGATRASPWW